jgi:uncharacterized membrane protein
MILSVTKKLLLVFILLGMAAPLYAQTEIYRAKVLEVVKEERSVILQEIGQQVEVLNQTLSVEIIDGPEEGKTVTLENDYMEIFSVKERDRQFPIIILILIFAVAIIIFGGKQGLRSLLSLVGGFLVIIYLLLPMLAKGYSPVLVSTGFASMILFIAIYFTHGFNRESSVAFGGTIIAVILTGLLAYFSVWIMQLTGFNTEETMFLNVGSTIKLNFQGLLLGGILIGVLGVLDDIAVTQAAVTSEIYSSNVNLTRGQVYRKAMRVGREHVSALVNTLVLAYTGASLPLLLLLSQYDYPLRFVISQELFATEIVRTIVGSIGLVLTVPITTLLAVYFLQEYERKDTAEHSH